MTKKTTKRLLKPIYEVQKIVHEKYIINPRTFQWYVTKGLVPKAEKIGREAFYDLDETKVNVFDYVTVIKLLQNLYGLGIEKIGEIIGKYRDQLKVLAHILQELFEKYPVAIPILGQNWSIQRKFLDTISGDEVIDLRSINLINIKSEVSKDWDPL